MGFAAGGEIILGYSNGTDHYEIRLPVAPFDAATLLYTGGGLTAPTESGIVETVQNFGVVWAPYFDASWSLTLESLYHSASGDGTRLGTVPAVAARIGTSPAVSPINPAIRRGFSFRTVMGNQQRLRLFGISSDVMGPARVATPSSGGFDARDRILIGYVSGNDTGLLCWDGYPFPPSARVYQRFQLRPFDPAGPVSAPGPASPPPGAGGDILLNIGGVWSDLPPTAPGDVLVLGGTPSAPMPQWGADCCSKDAPPPLSRVTTTPPLDEQPWGSVTGPAGSLQGGAKLATPQEALNQRYCAAAVAMSEYLIVNYDLVAKIMNSSFAAGVAALTYDVFFALAQKLTQVFKLPGFGGPGPSLVDLLNTIWQYIEGGTSGAGAFPNLASMILRLFPFLEDVQTKYIQCACYCALIANQGQVDATFVTVWRDYIGLAGTDIFPLPGLKAFCCALEDYVPLIYWQALAAMGALGHSSDCLGCNCAVFPPIRTGTALQGGARLRDAVGSALQGGAVFLPGGTGASLRGGAAYGGAGGACLTGGAVLTA